MTDEAEEDGTKHTAERADLPAAGPRDQELGPSPNTDGVYDTERTRRKERIKDEVNSGKFLSCERERETLNST